VVEKKKNENMSPYENNRPLLIVYHVKVVTKRIVVLEGQNHSLGPIKMLIDKAHKVQC